MVIPPEHVDFFFGAFPKLDSIEMVLNGVELAGSPWIQL